MKNFKKTKLINITALFILIALMFFLTVPNVLAASIFDKTFEGAKKVIGATYGEDVVAGVTKKPDTFMLGLIIIVNALVSLIGVIFLLLMLYAGWLWMNARGNEEDVEKAKKLLKESVIGLIIMILARIITELVLTQIGKII